MGRRDRGASSATGGRCDGAADGRRRRPPAAATCRPAAPEAGVAAAVPRPSDGDAPPAEAARGARRGAVPAGRSRSTLERAGADGLGSARRTAHDLDVRPRPRRRGASAWSEATLAYLHQLSCEDPLTGLASLAHVRTRLAEIYREAELSDVLVPRQPRPGRASSLLPGPRQRRPGDHFTRALRLVQVGASRSGRSSPVARRSSAGSAAPAWSSCAPSTAAPRWRCVRAVLADLDAAAEADVRVWIEGLPGAADSAARLLDELAR